MLNPIKEICAWQIAAGNASRPYDDFLESAFQIEEALEGHDLYELSLFINGPEYSDEVNAKTLSRIIVEHCYTKEPIPDVERLDKACDAIIFAIGSMQKLGLDHHAITKALNIVNDANKQKLNCKRDAEGKLLKPEGFVGPEVKLQALLDSIRR